MTNRLTIISFVCVISVIRSNAFGGGGGGGGGADNVATGKWQSSGSAASRWTDPASSYQPNGAARQNNGRISTSTSNAASRQSYSSNSYDNGDKYGYDYTIPGAKVHFAAFRQVNAAAAAAAAGRPSDWNDFARKQQRRQDGENLNGNGGVGGGSNRNKWQTQKSNGWSPSSKKNGGDLSAW